MKRIREYLAGKTPKQRVLIFIGAALLIVFIFFVIKNPQTNPQILQHLKYYNKKQKSSLNIYKYLHKIHNLLNFFSKII